VRDFRPFEDIEEIKKIQEERNNLLHQLQNLDMPESEKMFIIRKINNITEKLLEKARYGK